MKTYQKPNTDIVFVAMDKLLQEISNGMFNNGKTPDNSTIDLGGEFNETEETSGNLSRSFSVWGDDEE